MEIKQIIEEAIPLDMSCEIRRKAEIERRAKLRIRIEELLRDKSQPYKPNLEYKNGFNEIIPETGDFTLTTELPHRE